jgi:hypothetical protein
MRPNIKVEADSTILFIKSTWNANHGQCFTGSVINITSRLTPDSPVRAAALIYRNPFLSIQPSALFILLVAGYSLGLGVLTIRLGHDVIHSLLDCGRY